MHLQPEPIYCSFELSIYEVDIKMRFPCQFSLAWKIDDTILNIKETAKLMNNHLQFSSILKAQHVPMMFCQSAGRFLDKKSTVNLSFVTHTRPQEHRPAGTLIINLADVLNKQTNSPSIEASFSKCPDPDNKVRYVILGVKNNIGLIVSSGAQKSMTTVKSAGALLNISRAGMSHSNSNVNLTTYVSGAPGTQNMNTHLRKSLPRRSLAESIKAKRPSSGCTRISNPNNLGMFVNFISDQSYQPNSTLLKKSEVRANIRQVQTNLSGPYPYLKKPESSQQSHKNNQTLGQQFQRQNIRYSGQGTIEFPEASCDYTPIPLQRGAAQGWGAINKVISAFKQSPKENTNKMGSLPADIKREYEAYWQLQKACADWQAECENLKKINQQLETDIFNYQSTINQLKEQIGKYTQSSSTASILLRDSNEQLDCRVVLEEQARTILYLEKQKESLLDQCRQKDKILARLQEEFTVAISKQEQKSNRLNEYLNNIQQEYLHITESTKSKDQYIHQLEQKIIQIQEQMDRLVPGQKEIKEVCLVGLQVKQIENRTQSNFDMTSKKGSAWGQTTKPSETQRDLICKDGMPMTKGVNPPLKTRKTLNQPLDSEAKPVEFGQTPTKTLFEFWESILREEKLGLVNEIREVSIEFHKTKVKVLRVLNEIEMKREFVEAMIPLQNKICKVMGVWNRFNVFKQLGSNVQC